MIRAKKNPDASIHINAEGATEHDVREWEYLLEIRRQLIELSERINEQLKLAVYYPYRDISSPEYEELSDENWRKGAKENTIRLTDKEKSEIQEAIEHHGAKLLLTWCDSYQKDLDTEDYIGENPDKRAAVNPFFALVGFINEGIIPPPEFLIYLSLKVQLFVEGDLMLDHLLFGLPKPSVSSTASSRRRMAMRNIKIYELAVSVRAKNEGIKVEPLAEKTLDILQAHGFEDFKSVDSVRDIINTWDRIVKDHEKVSKS